MGGIHELKQKYTFYQKKKKKKNAVCIINYAPKWIDTRSLMIRSNILKVNELILCNICIFYTQILFKYLNLLRVNYKSKAQITNQNSKNTISIWSTQYE